MTWLIWPLPKSGKLGNIWEQLIFKLIDGLPLSACAGVRIHLERGRHVRVAELCLRHAQWCPLLVKKCSMRMSERMPGNRREFGAYTRRMQLPFAQIV